MLEENYAKRKHDQSYFLQKAIFINTSKIKFSKIEKNFTFFSLSQQKPLFKTFPSEYYFLNKKFPSEESQLKFSNDIKHRTLSTSHIPTSRQIIRNKKNDTLDIQNLSRYNLLREKILQQRKICAIKISSFVKRKLEQITNKKKFILNYILKKRKYHVTKVQSILRGYFIRKHLKNLFKSDFVFFYYMTPETLKQLYSPIINPSTTPDMKLKIYSRTYKGKEISFSYSKYLDTYYLPLMKKGIIKRQYRVNFIVNEHIIIDPRYEVGSDEKGNFYNIILKKMLYNTKNRTKKISPQKKYWENIFKIKAMRRHSNSCDSISISNTDISNNDPLTGCSFGDQFNVTYRSNNIKNGLNEFNIKPILKKNITKSESSEIRLKNKAHKVSFSNYVQYSY